MEASAVIPVTSVEEQPIGGTVSLVRGSPIVDEVMNATMSQGMARQYWLAPPAQW